MAAIKEFSGKSIFLKWSQQQHDTVYVNDKFVAVDEDTNLDTLPTTHPWLLKHNLVVKVDQLVKRRGKLGLVKVNLNWDQAKAWLTEHVGKIITIDNITGKLTTFMIEAAVPHTDNDEMYVAIRPFHDRNHSSTDGKVTLDSGDEILFCRAGGVEMGDAELRKDVYALRVPLQQVPKEEDVRAILLKDLEDGPVKDAVCRFLTTLFDFYIDSHHVFLEINPFVVLGPNNSDEYHQAPAHVSGHSHRVVVLDWAGKLDSDARWECRHLWNDLSFPEGFGALRTPEEDLVRELDSETGASFKLTVLNPTGAVWTLVAGGGASVMYADAICSLGFASELGNYGEYSGGPSTDLTMRYADALFRVMLREKIDTPKVLLIGGAVANFTSVAGTFKGIIQALTTYVDELLAQKVHIFVRRGGPGYEVGLEMMSKFGAHTGVPVDVNGPDENMVSIVNKGLRVAFPERMAAVEKTTGSEGPATLETYKLPQKLQDEIVAGVRANAGVGAEGGATSVESVMKELFTPETTCIVFALRDAVIQRMLDFDFACGRPTPSIACIVDPMASHRHHKCFFGSREILLRVFSSIPPALTNNPSVSVLVNLASSRSVYTTVMDAMCCGVGSIKAVAIFAEGVPERQARLLAKEANARDVILVGPATVGGIHAGSFRIGNSGGTNENILACRLFREGSVGYVTRSGGLSNELNYLLARTTDGVLEGIAIGGDRYPGSGFLEHLLRFQQNPRVQLLVMVGEVGGTAEYAVCEALKNKVITKPLVAMCTGVAAESLNRPGMKFGHAGASANSDRELASAKNRAMAEAGAIVPKNFEEFEFMIKSAYEVLHHAGCVPAADHDANAKLPVIPLDLSEARARGFVRVPTHFISTISDDRQQELHYNSKPISQVVDEAHGIGAVLGLLWFKKSLPTYMTEFLEKIIIIVADHGPAVSGAHNTIVTARAGKDLISCLVSGLLTIGDRFGGAINGAAVNFYDCCAHGTSADAFVAKMKREGQYIPGIGHRIKSLRNPDMRVKILVEYAKANFPSTPTLDFALQVEQITTQKKENLILNVDGAIGACMVDLLCNCGLFDKDEGRKYIEIGCLNGLFVLGRSIGLLGHAIDQKRLDSNLYRHDPLDILYEQSL